MTMPSTGVLNLGGTSSPISVAQELGLGLTTTISMNDAGVRTLAGVSAVSGTQYSMNSFYGKSNRISISITISTNQTNYVLNTAKATGYAAGRSDVTLTINSGIYVSSNTTGGHALNVDTSWAAGDTVTIINNGLIIGMGGAGGAGASFNTFTGNGAASGGPALRAQRATTINNAGTIAGGGGGGGGGAACGVAGLVYNGGSGGGGGRSSAAANSAAGGAGAGNTGGGYSNGNPGSAGTSASAGGGGAGVTNVYTSGSGGTGGGWGAAGATGGSSTEYSTEGNPIAFPSGGSGGSGGAAVVGNANITWTATGTRIGAIT